MSKCFLWPGPVYPNGYGRMNKGYRSYLAHKVVFQGIHGPVPTGFVVMHRCDNRACVNPAHLKLGTQSDNMQDMLQKNRQSVGPALGVQNPNYRHGRLCGTNEERKAYHAEHEAKRRARLKQESLCV